MARIMGIDPSLNGTGLATTSSVQVVRVGNRRGAERLVFVRDAVAHSMNLCDPQLVVLEGYSYSPNPSIVAMGELGGVLRVLLYERGVPWMEVPPSSLKKFAIGKGNADKQTMLAAARTRLGYSGTSMDEADAMWLREAGLYVYGGKGRRLDHSTVTEGQANAIHGLGWPALAAL